MIKKITKIKNFGIFKDFNWDQNIPDFRKHNLFYGWNYSGKTTVSRIFHCFELGQKHIDYLEAEFEMIDEHDNKYTESEADLNKLPNIRVFNIDFIINNFKGFLRGDNELEPIFILGEENIKLQKKFDDLIEDQKNKKENQIKLLTHKNDIEEALETAFTNKARDIKNTLSIPDYNRERFKPEVDKIKDSFKDNLLIDDEFNKLFSTYSNTEQRAIINLKSLPLFKFSHLQNKVKEIVTREISAKNIIEDLKIDEKLNRWVKEGKELHEGKERCSFCGNILPSDLFDKLEQHFSNEYEQMEIEIKNLLENIKTHNKEIDNFLTPSKAELYPHLSVEYESNQKALNEKIEKYQDNLKSLSDYLRIKNAKPFTEHSFEEIPNNSETINDKFEAISEVVQKHNNKTENFQKEKNIAKNKLIKHFAAQFIQDQNYIETLNNIIEIQNSLSSIETLLKEIEGNIREIEKKLSESVKGAEKVNTYIQRFFRHDGIKLEVTDSKMFRLVRNSKPAKNLSEGEKTAISFAYFMTKLQDKNTTLEETIVFIDDPVSSLDYNHLFNIYAFIKSKLKNCYQLFVATHNLDFFNLMKDFLRRSCKDYDNEKYKNNIPCYLVQKERNATDDEDGESTIKQLHKTLIKHRTEYNYLFNLLKEFDEKTDGDEDIFKLLYLIPNITRRFLEGYIGIRYPNGQDWVQNLDKYNLFSIEDREKVLKLINVYSHEDSLEHSLKFPDFAECKEVIHVVLKCLKEKDKVHYDALCQSCN